MTLVEVLEQLAERWRTPRQVVHDGKPVPLLLRCRISRATGSSRETVPPRLPPGLAQLWTYAEEARLFEDATFGQWGLVLHGPAGAGELTRLFLQERASEALPGDLIVGEFLGDQDLLLVRADPSAEDFARVHVVPALERRPGWPLVGLDIASFVQLLADAEGEKFWDRTGALH